ncbi:hypothetical protein [Brevibacillus fortis]|uniref:hypothetical protein n=1 Tax=Brevibacillus fortis TaxID=2126352 RepID=UPI001304D784|nr:hypothetical protein [Brevibacillus fortis]
MDNKKFETLMYFLVKRAARESFVDFIDNIGLTMDDYAEIKKYLKDTYGIKTYL